MKKVKVDDLQRHTCGIYCLRYPNNKIYIGQSVDIKRRMWEHNNINRLNSHIQSPCDLAIKKYGPFKEIIILEECSPNELDEKEKYWIQYYRSNQKDKGYNLDSGGKSGRGEQNKLLSDEEVLDIRKRRFNSERKKDVFKDYEDKITFAGFENIWLGNGYSDIGQEYIIPTNSISRKEYSSKANKGSNNGRAKLNEDKVKDIRSKYKEGIPYQEIHKNYPEVTLSTIKKVCLNYTWKHVK